MTYKEAIELLKEMHSKCHMPTASDPKRFNKALALEIAIEALDKQIHKKPSERIVRNAIYAQEIRWCCPTCGNVVEVDDNEYYKTELYPACRCGQRIDWTDELDEYHMKWKRYEVK